MSACPDLVVDPEAGPAAPRPPAPPSRARRLLCCVLAAVTLLLAVVVAAAVAAGATGAADGTRAGPTQASAGPPGSSRGSSLPPQTPPELTARLLARNVTLNNGTLSWYSQQGMAGVHLSPGLAYDEHRQELVVAKTGRYQVCLHLELSHVLPSSRVSGKVSLTLHLEPPQAEAAIQDLAVALTPSSSALVRESRCQPLQAPDGQRLSVHLSVYLPTVDGGHQAWQLAQPATKLELFQVPDGRLFT